MKIKSLGIAIALVAAAPAVIAPQLVATAHAADTAEYPDVPKNHWAYEALNRLSSAGIVEGQPGGVYVGNKAMTRYEFAVAIARLLDKMPVIPAPNNVQQYILPADIAGLPPRVAALEAKPTISPAEVNDLIAALRREFADELSKLGVRVDAVENRLAIVEARIAAPPRLTITPSILWRSGLANYVNNSAGGRAILAAGSQGLGPSAPVFRGGVFANNTDAKYSYTDFELRLTDRVTDRLSVNAALRSISGTQEDPWAGESLLGGGDFELREAFAVADLSDRSFLGTKNWNLSIGRQHTKIAQGLLYNNDLLPTDQAKATFNIGPVALTGILGSTNNNSSLGLGLLGGANPYYTQGAAFYLGATNAPIVGGAFNGQRNSSVVGFNSLAGAGAAGAFADDNEALLRAGFNLFKIAGNPVQVGATRQFDGVSSQRADSFDLTLPLFNRTVGFEYLIERKYADGTTPGGSKPNAYNVTVPVLRTRALDLNFAYGKADDGFEYLLSSSANPFARTYGEALFDRNLALGAPMIAGGTATTPTYMAAKKVYDVGGTLRVIRRLPLDLRYYSADGSGGVGLGHVISVGSTINVTPGLDLEVKFGQYNPSVAGVGNVKYFRVGANVGF